MINQLLTATTPELVNLAMLLGRLGIGFCFIMHALGKFGYVGPGGSMKGFAEWLKSLNVPFPVANAWAAMFTEFIGGVLLLAGLFTRPACLALIVVMSVAGLVGHKGAGYMITNNPPGNEYTINLALILFVFLLLGPGHYSLDMMLFGV